MFKDMTRKGWMTGAAGLMVVAVLVGATVAGVTAQGPQGGPRHERGRGGRPGPGFGPGGGAFGLGPIMRLGSLTDAQREQLRTLAQSRREEGATLVRQLAEARKALMASAETGAVDETKAAEIGAAVSSLAVAQARLHADALAILTPEQKTELTAQRNRMQEWWQSRPDGAGAPGSRGRGRPAR